MIRFELATRARSELSDVTAQVAEAVRKTAVAEGVCHVYVPHTTAGITINESADPDVVLDILMKLDRLVPRGEGYRHAEGNSDAHIKAGLIGSSVSIPVSGGSLLLGTWQAVYFCEFDGPRRRSVIVTVCSS